MVDIGMIANVATVLGISIHQLWRATRQAAGRYGNRDAEARIANFLDASRRFMAEGHGTAFTKRYYGESVLDQAGLQRYGMEISGELVMTSLATARTWIGARVPLGSEHEDCSLVPAPPQAPRPTDREAAEILNDIQARNLKIWNSPIFRLLDLSLKKRDLAAKFCIDDFLRYRFTTGALHDELIQALQETGFNIEDVINRGADLLKLREKHLPPTRALTDFGPVLRLAESPL